MKEEVKITHQSVRIVSKDAKSSLKLVLTEHLKYLGLGPKDRVFVSIVETEIEKKIIIRKA